MHCFGSRSGSRFILYMLGSIYIIYKRKLNHQFTGLVWCMKGNHGNDDHSLKFGTSHQLSPNLSGFVSKMQNPNFMVIVPQFQTQPNTVSYRDRLGYVRDLPVISLYHMGFPKIGGTQIESCETYGLGVLSCHGFPHIPIAYCSPGHSQHQWAASFPRCSSTLHAVICSLLIADLWPVVEKPPMATCFHHLQAQFDRWKMWTKSKPWNGGVVQRCFTCFFAAALWRSGWSGWLGHGKGTPEGTAGMLFSHFLPKLALLLKTDLAGEKSSSKGGRASFCAQIMSDSVWICLVYSSHSIYLLWTPALLNSSKQKMERSYSPFLRLPLSSAKPGVNKNTGIIQF